MPVPIVYRRSGEGVIATYNYADVAEGTGVVVYYGFDHKEVATASYALTTEAAYSNDVYTTANATDQADYTKIMDMDFDLKFNRPQRIKGKVRAITSLGGGEAGANKTGLAYIVLKIRKYSGTTETEIASATSPTLTFDTSLQIYWEVYNFEVNVASIVGFKKGDILRATVEVWAKKTTANNAAVYFAHDPKNRISSGVLPQTAGSPAAKQPQTSIFELHVPFVIDL